MNKPKTVGNAPASVANKTVEKIVNKTAQKSTLKVLEEMVKLDTISYIAEDLAGALALELRNASFMTEQLELTDKQKEKLGELIKEQTRKARDKYIANRKKDDRLKKVRELTISAMSGVIVEALNAIGQEVNRGALLHCKAVSADVKGKAYRIELRHFHDGDITVPTKGIFISTNCVQLIMDSCGADLPPELLADEDGVMPDVKDEEGDEDAEGQD